MAESIISPGVFTTENDQSQIVSGPVQFGAAIIGPTVLGRRNVPVEVTSYSQYKAIFGSTFVSGGLTYEFLTSIAALNYFEQGGTSLLVTPVGTGSWSPAFSEVSSPDGVSFVLETLSDGVVMNNEGGSVTNGALPSGSSANIRWEIAQADTTTGQFTLFVRRGDDYDTNKVVLETWSGLSLDPNQSNYIAYVIGDQRVNPIPDENGNYYLQYTGSYANKSKYVRVREVSRPTPGYFNSFGQPVTAYTGSIPTVGSGSSHGTFSGATGQLSNGLEAMNLFENIPNTAGFNIQGVSASDYNIAISLLANSDAYRYNVLYVPGLNAGNAASQISDILAYSQTRGDNMAVVDMVGYGQSVASVVSRASAYDSSYAATYWPWVQIRSRETGRVNFVPASVIIPGVYEYNDKVSAEWFAPAGLNRGGLPTVIQPERRLSRNDRNTLYLGKVNPIAPFPGEGTVIYGQKTLQVRATALDRVNVRRLMIELKRYIGRVGEKLIFEPNTEQTRIRFKSEVIPYLEYVQQRQGLYAFDVVMDDSNNTQDVIDRNQLVGSIYLQPTRVAEFILLDFNILPTGVTFSQ